MDGESTSRSWNFEWLSAFLVNFPGIRGAKRQFPVDFSSGFHWSFFFFCARFDSTCMGQVQLCAVCCVTFGRTGSRVTIKTPSSPIAAADGDGSVLCWLWLRRRGRVQLQQQRVPTSNKQAIEHAKPDSLSLGRAHDTRRACDLAQLG